EALPRTRLGKFRRFLLPALFARALSGSTGRAPRPPTEALLREPTAAAVWQVLFRHFRDHPLDLDIDLGLDLDLASLGLLEVSILLQERLGSALPEPDVARIGTIRDLLACRSIDGPRPARRNLAGRRRHSMSNIGWRRPARC